MKVLKNPPTNEREFGQNPSHRNKPGKLFTALATALALGAGSASAALTNFLANPGFELGTSGWSMVSPWTWQAMNKYCSVQNTNNFVYNPATGQNSGTLTTVHSGTNAMKIWGYNQNTYTTTPGVQQTFPAAAGSTWAASTWVSTQVPDNITTNVNGVTEKAYLQVLFLDVTTTNTLATFTSAAIDNTSPTSTWLYLAPTDSSGNTNLTAPAGTAFVRYELIFSQPSTGGHNPPGSSYWDDAVLFKTSKPDPEITVNPLPVTVLYGRTASFSVVADGLTGLTYKWQKDGSDISDPNAHGVNTATLTLSNVTTAMQGGYTCTVTDQAGPLTSNPAQLTVLDPGVVSITPPFGQTITNGNTAKITVSAVGSTTLTYSWQNNGVSLSDNGHITGSTSSNLTVANATGADAGTYIVTVNGAAQATNGLKVVYPAQLATNLLLNPGFEDGVLSEPWENAWGHFNGAALATANDYYYLSATPVSIADGSYVCQLYGSDADDGIDQTVPATVGATYHAGGLFYESSLDSLGVAAGIQTTVTLQFMFKDAAGNTMTTYSAPVITTGFTEDTWVPLQVTNATGGLDLVAPAGAASITCQVYMFNWGYGGGSVYIDNLYVTQTQSAALPSFSINTAVSGSQINISFPTTSGVTYDVLYTSDLRNQTATWQTLTSVTGNGNVMSVPDSLGTTGRFYRVRAH